MTWKKGVSGNPQGRPRLPSSGDFDLVQECRKLSPKALQTLEVLMLTSAQDNVRFNAAKLILERAYGTPIQFTSDATPGEFAAAIRAQLEATGVRPPGNT